MARLVRSTPVEKKKVYDVTVAETHSFFAYSREGDSDYAVLAHNCHELSKSAMDAMLKPLEDNIRGTEERQLVCIFCTTEPNKMRGAIKSRCAPAFKIRINTPEEIATRLERWWSAISATASRRSRVSRCWGPSIVKMWSAISTSTRTCFSLIYSRASARTCLEHSTRSPSSTSRSLRRRLTSAWLRSA